MLSQIISKTEIAPVIDKFVAKDKFIVDTSKTAIIKIAYICRDFELQFLGKTEYPFSGGIIYGRKINKSLADGPIFSELGGRKKAETTLVEIYSMMKRQANGESGPLRNDSYANIFYVCDITGALCAVSVDWLDEGWFIYALSVESTSVWNIGDQVFSHELDLRAA